MPSEEGTFVTIAIKHHFLASMTSHLKNMPNLSGFSGDLIH